MCVQRERAQREGERETETDTEVFNSGCWNESSNTGVRDAANKFASQFHHNSTQSKKQRTRGKKNKGKVKINSAYI